MVILLVRRFIRWCFEEPSSDQDSEFNVIHRQHWVPVEKTFLDRHGWIPAEESVLVAGRYVGGMIYVGTPPILEIESESVKCSAYIDHTLPVARIGDDMEGDGLERDRIGYSDIHPICRATYLDWLENGRADPSYSPLYMFLYFFGIERRFFCDNPSKDEQKILLKEVKRLSSVYSENGTVQRYLGEFIQVAEYAATPNEIDQLEPIFDNPGWDLPFSLRLALGVQVEDGTLMDADWVLSWLICHPEYSLRMPATRCFEEFRALFRIRFKQKYPQGLKVEKPQTSLVESYQAASGEFSGTVSARLGERAIPDISGLRKPVTIAHKLAEKISNELDKYSRYLGRNPTGRGSLEAQALLPNDLWSIYPSDELDNLKSWTEEIVNDGGIVPLAEVFVRVSGKQPEKISKKQLTDAADLFARLGFGFAPDPRFALRSPRLDEPVVLFELGAPVDQLKDASATYRSALIELALKTFVAHSDGEISESESRWLEEQVESVKRLRQQERKRLRANLKWFLTVPPNLTMLRRKLKDLDSKRSEELRAAVVASAHADGVIGAKEVSDIEKIYTAFGFDASLAYSDLHTSDFEIQPRPTRSGRNRKQTLKKSPGERTSSQVSLDTAKIASIQFDTERVSSVLGEIFSNTTDAVEETQAEVLLTLNGLDLRHTALVGELVQRDHWTEGEFEQLCTRHDLLASGALEAVNEWAFDAYSGILLDEYNGYEINKDIVPELNSEIDNLSLSMPVRAEGAQK